MVGVEDIESPENYKKYIFIGTGIFRYGQILYFIRLPKGVQSSQGLKTTGNKRLRCSTGLNNSLL
jgi:hypothetical protein